MKSQVHSSGSKQHDKWKVKMEKSEVEYQPLINLCLGIGETNNSSFCCRSTATSNVNKCQKDRNVKVEVDDHDFDQVVERVGCRKSSVVRFTEDQLKELELQLIIFKYMLWGLPVPLQLLIPIWRSLSPSFTHTSYPLWVGIRSRGTYHRNLMDPEPGRCRRTDGKKWRCYQAVVPNEKYCKKHMHRGRKRSRKLVEDVMMHAPNENDALSKNAESTPAFEVPAILNRISQPLSDPSRVVIKAPDLTLTDCVTRADKKMETSNEGKHGKIMKERIDTINLASSLDFSTKNVHQDGDRCSEAEWQAKAPRQVPQRCSRTDGRKWQCHSEAIPGLKYCAQHINRGLKKPAISPSATREPKPANISSSTQKFCEPEQAKMGMGLDTDLNISLLHPRPNIIDSVTGSSSSSSSDASTETTISDDNAYMSNLITVSPRMQ